MGLDATARPAPVTVATDLALTDLWAALAAGWRDFAARPLYGLFFAGIYVVAGLMLYYALFTQDKPGLLIAATAGFPLVAPFVAVGLYEVSRRRETGLPISWGPVLGALRGHGDEQLFSMGGLVFIAFSFWLAVAHGIFAVFMAEAGVGAGSLLAQLQTPAGLAMLAVGSAVGGAMALAFYALMVISLPMLVDRQVDFITAMIVSIKAVRGNLPVMLAWAVLIAVALAMALLPMFLGLLVVLPVLAHATWHLYRRVTR